MHPWLPYNEFSRRLKWWLGRLIDRMEALERAFKLLKAHVKKLEDRLDEAIADLEQKIQEAIDSLTEIINNLEETITNQINSILETISNIQTIISNIQTIIQEIQDTGIVVERLTGVNNGNNSNVRNQVMRFANGLVMEWGYFESSVEDPIQDGYQFTVKLHYTADYVLFGYAHDDTSDLLEGEISGDTSRRMLKLNGVGQRNATEVHFSVVNMSRLGQGNYTDERYGYFIVYTVTS